MSNRFHINVSLVCVGFAVIFLADAYNTRHDLRASKNFSEARGLLYETEASRSRLLQDDLYEISSKPTYQEGYRDAVIRAGTPTHSGAYRDGYYAAFLALGDTSYADGYHAAILQFGYPKTDVPPSSAKVAAERERRKLLEEFEKYSPYKNIAGNN